MVTAAPPTSPAWTGLASPARAPGCPIRHGPPRTVRPASLPPNPPAFSEFSGHCCFLLKFLAPLAPSPPWERAAMPGHLLVSAGRGGEQLAGPGSCEVRGCQGEGPRLGGVMGKLGGNATQSPSCRSLCCSLSAFLASECSLEGRDHCVLLASGSARNVHLSGPGYLAQSVGTSSSSPDACSREQWMGQAPPSHPAAGLHRRARDGHGGGGRPQGEAPSWKG